jgi:hypothetical protein
MRRMVRIQIQVPSDVAERLRELSKENRSSIAGIVRRAVNEAMLRPGMTPLRKERWERSLSAVGRFGPRA